MGQVNGRLHQCPEPPEPGFMQGDGTDDRQWHTEEEFRHTEDKRIGYQLIEVE